MSKFKKAITGVVALIFIAAVSSFAGQTHNSANAASTLSGVNNQVITIGTTDGLDPNAAIDVYAYSGDGNVVLFKSSATNLPNAGGLGGLYTYNIKTNTTLRVDVSSSGVQANNKLEGYTPENMYKISETGRYVTFITLATNLIDGQTQGSGYYYVYKRDMQTGVITYIDSHYDDSNSYNMVRNLSISNDGQFVLLASRDILGSFPYPYGIILGDSASGGNVWTRLAEGNDSKNQSSQVVTGGMSCDGSFVVFTAGNYDVRLVDVRRGNAITLDTALMTSISPIISCNGRYVLYATNNRTQITPTPAGLNAYLRLVRYDRITGERMYIDSDSSGVFASTQYTYYSAYDPQPNIFKASIADTGDVVFKYNNNNVYLKHLSDGSGTLESIAVNSSGSYVNANNGEITQNGQYIFFRADPYSLGMSPSPSGIKIIRTRTNLY